MILRISLLFLCLLQTSPLFARTLVFHSQSVSVPGCPNDDWTLLWNGYSLMGAYWSGGRRSNQDLSSSGSCVPHFSPMPLIECRQNYCDYGTGGDYSQWFVTERYVDEGGINLGGYPNSMNTNNHQAALARVSRCSVCEVNKPIIVKHSMSSTVPGCPTKWEKLWDGYSYGMGGRDSGYSSWQDLSDTGSCQKLFVPNNTLPCWQDACDYNNTYNMWMIAGETSSDRSRTWYSGAPLVDTKNRIGRCAVCIKQ